MPYPFSRVVTTQHELREIAGTPSDGAVRKQLARLDAHCLAFIARSPFVLVGTAGAAGRCDVSPRGDAPGFVLALDEGTLLLPERPGNRRVDTLSNIIENPHVGLLFLIPGLEETLRVNGRAVIVRDADLLERMAVQGKAPRLGIGVAVEEAYIHCAKSFKRARLWHEEAKIDRSTFPSLARIVMDQLQLTDCTVEELDQMFEADYQKLY
jgi:PPOX class probable FMN-dependent enzyme